MKWIITILFLFGVCEAQDTVYVATWTSCNAPYYKVYQSTDSKNWSLINTVTDTTCIIPGYTYYYKVTGDTTTSNTILITNPNPIQPPKKVHGNSKHFAMTYGNEIKISGGTFELYDITGRLVRKGTNEQTLQVPSGIYILKIDNDYKKIIVQ